MHASIWRGRGAPAVAVVAFAVLAAACTSPDMQKRKTIYGPTESLLEVVAVLRRHVPDDTYRFAPAVDFTGRNIYRASLIRLENIEASHAEALHAGHMDGVIAFSKARALERLRHYELAAVRFREASEREAMLAPGADRSAEICDDLVLAAGIGVDLVDPLASAPTHGGGGPQPTTLSTDAEGVVAMLDERVARLEELHDEVADVGPHHYLAVIREEIERADVARAQYFVHVRHVLPDGPVRAVSELQRVVARHPASKNRREHVLELADFYALMAEEYVEAHPSSSLRFDPPRFSELVDAATHLYRSVAGQDGTPEKIEAARRLEAFLAFTLQVDRDRFTQ